MATKTSEADWAQRSARVYERQLREQLERHGTPDLAPEAAGRRAALFTAGGQAWADEVGPFYDTQGARAALGGVSKQAVSQRVNAGRLLGLRLASDGTGRDRMVYPVWQFRPGVLQHLPDVLRTAGYVPNRPVTGWTIAASTADLTSAEATGYGLNAEIHTTLDYSTPRRWGIALWRAGWRAVRHRLRGDVAQTLAGRALFGAAALHARAPAGMSTAVEPLDTVQAEQLLAARNVEVRPIPAHVPLAPPA